MLPSDLSPGDIEFWLEPPVLLALQSGVRELIERGVDKEAASLAVELRDKLGGMIREVGPSPKPLNAYAIDSSYPTPPLELIGGVLTVLSYGYVGYLNGSYDRYVTGELFFEDVGEFERAITRRAQLRERELGVRLLRERSRGKAIDLIILDGEITIHPLPYNLPIEGGLLAPVGKVINEFLALAQSTGVPIVGVVKRVRSRLLSVFTGKCLPVNDKLMMSLILKPGEYVVLGRHGDLLPRWLEINYNDCELRKHCRGGDCPEVRALMRRRLEEGLENLGRVFTGDDGRLRGISLVKDITTVFYRPRNGAPAVKLEVLNPGGALGIEDLVSYLESQTTDTGYPFLLDRVDEYVRLNPSILDYVRSMVLRESTELSEALVTMLQLTNPQKAYLVRRLEA
ncbi:DNA double-strand break repair nuclease NurA [Vulcanisaeta thermophila]|uniref:DNA double-strand break repair nuclease NurA n=1 Tax=Vulcanisaeta thermophila TaxID=867917 RepID=UPI000852AD32|nr:DNA double-strand break repair nuclease NurA [Vulcanisaeta thermophila]